MKLKFVDQGARYLNRKMASQVLLDKTFLGRNKKLNVIISQLNVYVTNCKGSTNNKGLILNLIKRNSICFFSTET